MSGPETTTCESNDNSSTNDVIDGGSSIAASLFEQLQTNYILNCYGTELMDFGTIPNLYMDVLVDGESALDCIDESCPVSFNRRDIKITVQCTEEVFEVAEEEYDYTILEELLEPTEGLSEYEVKESLVLPIEFLVYGDRELSGDFVAFDTSFTMVRTVEKNAEDIQDLLAKYGISTESNATDAEPSG